MRLLVTAAALLFCVAIGAFASSHIFFIKQLGVGAALAVAIDATVVRALLVPALMGTLGEWAWWAPRPLRRLHGRIGLREGAGEGSGSDARHGGHDDRRPAGHGGHDDRSPAGHGGTLEGSAPVGVLEG